VFTRNSGPIGAVPAPACDGARTARIPTIPAVPTADLIERLPPRTGCPGASNVPPAAAPGKPDNQSSESAPVGPDSVGASARSAGGGPGEESAAGGGILTSIGRTQRAAVAAPPSTLSRRKRNSNFASSELRISSRVPSGRPHIRALKGPHAFFRDL